jgi:hypothetical protein
VESWFPGTFVGEVYLLNEPVKLNGKKGSRKAPLLALG